MDYFDCENCIMLVDKSGLQPLIFAMHTASLDVHGFLLESKVKMVITEIAIQAGEFTHQTYDQNLFSGSHVVNNSTVTIDDISNNNYVISSADGVLTTANVDNNGYEIGVLSEQYSEGNNCLWETSKYWRKLSEPDKSIIYAARYLTFHNEKFFILVNDSDIINQLHIEGFQYLRNSTFLSWMVKSGYISYQKGTRVYREWQSYDPRWVKKDIPFGNILQNFN